MRQAAILFTLISVAVFVFQVALVLGAPLGHLTQGGFTHGSLSARGKGIAAVSSVMTAAMALVILMRGEVIARRRLLGGQAAIWVVLVLVLAGLVMNLISPSRPERMLWSPVLAVLLITAGIVAALSARPQV